MKIAWVCFPLALMACGLGGDIAGSSIEQALGGTANIQLKRSSAHM